MMNTINYLVGNKKTSIYNYSLWKIIVMIMKSRIRKRIKYNWRSEMINRLEQWIKWEIVDEVKYSYQNQQLIEVSLLINFRFWDQFIVVIRSMEVKSNGE